MGTLYSRCIGALKSNGIYIMGLDHDDLFSNENILKTVYLNAKINYFDIVEIKSLNIQDYSPKYKQIKNGYFINHPNNLILHQPELGKFSISYNNKLEFRDHYAWGKCIRSKIYKRSVNKLGYLRYSTYNCWTEDMSIVFILFNTAKSFIFLNLFGIFHIQTNTTATYKLSKIHKVLSSIFFLDIIFNFSRKNKESKRFVAQFALRFSLEKIEKLDEKGKLYFKSIINNLSSTIYLFL